MCSLDRMGHSPNSMAQIPVPFWNGISYKYRTISQPSLLHTSAYIQHVLRVIAYGGKEQPAPNRHEKQGMLQI